MENLTTQLGELFLAIQRSDVHQVRRLLSARVSPNQCNADGKTALMVASSIGNPTIIQMLCVAAATHKPPEQIFLGSRVATATHQTPPSASLISPALDSYPPAATLANAKQLPTPDYSAILSQPQPELPLPDYASTLSTLTDRTLIDSVLKSAPTCQGQPALSPKFTGAVIETSATTTKTVAEGLMNLASKGLQSLTGKRQPAVQPSAPYTDLAQPAPAAHRHRASSHQPSQPPPIVESPPLTTTTTNSAAVPIDATPATHMTTDHPPSPAKIAPEKTAVSASQTPDIEEIALEALLHGSINQLPEIEVTQNSPNPNVSNQHPTEAGFPDDMEFTDTFAKPESVIHRAPQRPHDRHPPPHNPAFIRTPVPISKTSTPTVANSDLNMSFLQQTSPLETPSANAPHSGSAHSGSAHSGSAHSGRAHSGSTHSEQPHQGQIHRSNNAPLDHQTPEHTPLESAVRRNDVGSVVSLLKAGVDFRPATWYDTPVLVTAAALGHGEIVQILIGQGANVNSGYDHLPLHSAAANGHVGITQMLLNAGAYIHGREDDGKTALIAAAANGHLQVVQILMERGADYRAVSQGETALTIASKNGHQAVYDYLKSGRHAQTPGWNQAHHASSQRPAQRPVQRPNQGSPGKDISRYEEQLQAIQGNLDNTALTSQPSQQQSHLGEASSGGASVTSQKLVQALLTAAADGHLPQLKQALANGAEVNEVLAPAPNHDQRTALSVAIQAGHIRLVEALLDANADANKPDETAAGVPTRYPIIAAACSSSAIHRSDIISLLLLQGARINQTDNRGRTALMHAIAAQHLDAIATLIAAHPDLDTKDIEGRTALNYAEATGQPQIVQPLQQAKQQQQQAIELLKAITQGKTHQVQQLLSTGVSPNAVAEGMSALDQAAAKGFVAIAQQLISAGADINGRANASELNPLLYAAYRGQFEMVELLISLGADLHTEVDNQFNALSYAYLGRQQKRNIGRPFEAIIHRLQAQGLKTPSQSISNR